METDPLSLIEVDPADARDLVIGSGQMRYCLTARDETVCQSKVTILACTSFFVRLRGRFFVPA
jgi:hypothetical protein